MKDLQNALWCFVFMFAIQAVLQTCVAFEITTHVTRIANRMPQNNLSRKDLVELEHQLRRTADNLGKCGR